MVVELPGVLDKTLLAPLAITRVVERRIHHVDERVVLLLLLACGREHVGGGEDFVFAAGAMLPVGTAVPCHATILRYVERVVIGREQLPSRIMILDVAVAVDVQAVVVTAKGCGEQIQRIDFQTGVQVKAIYPSGLLVAIAIIHRVARVLVGCPGLIHAGKLASGLSLVKTCGAKGEFARPGGDIGTRIGCAEGVDRCRHRAVHALDAHALDGDDI